MADVEFREMKIKCMEMKRGGWIDVRGCERGVVNESISGGTSNSEIRGTVVSMEIQSGSYLTSELRGKKVPCMLCHGRGVEVDRKLGIATMREEGEEKSMDRVLHVLNCEGNGKLNYLREEIRKLLPEGHALKESKPHEKWAQFVVNPASNKLREMRVSCRQIKQEKEEKRKQQEKEDRRRTKKGEKKCGGETEKEGERSVRETVIEVIGKAEKEGEIRSMVKELVEELVERVIGTERQKGEEKDEMGQEKEGEKERNEEREEKERNTRWKDRDREDVAKGIRTLCRLYLKTMHELRNERTRQRQAVMKWKEMIGRKKRKKL